MKRLFAWKHSESYYHSNISYYYIIPSAKQIPESRIFTESDQVVLYWAPKTNSLDGQKGYINQLQWILTEFLVVLCYCNKMTSGSSFISITTGLAVGASTLSSSFSFAVSFISSQTADIDCGLDELIDVWAPSEDVPSRPSERERAKDRSSLTFSWALHCWQKWHSETNTQ